MSLLHKEKVPKLHCKIWHFIDAWKIKWNFGCKEFRSWKFDGFYAFKFQGLFAGACSFQGLLNNRNPSPNYYPTKKTDVLTSLLQSIK